MIPLRFIWLVKAAPHAAFFVWTAVKGEILTKECLRKKGIIIVDCC